MNILSLRLFVRVAERGAVAAAGRDLSLSPASASARLAKLEDALGFHLFYRTTRAVTLTADGAAFLPYAQQVVDTFEAGLGVVTGTEAQPKGILRMAMPGSFGRMYVVPLIAGFQERFPLVKLDLWLSDELINVVEGAYDLCIRNAPLVDSGLISRRLATDQRLLVASPTYLANHGVPSKPEDLEKHSCVTLVGMKNIEFENGQSICTPPGVVVNDGEAMRKLIESGVGIGIKSVWNAIDRLKSGELIEVLQDYPLRTESSIWILFPNNRIVVPKVRAMIDYLVEHFTPTPPWAM